MSKRDALRALGKKFPAPKEIKSILDGLKDEPDRSAAIIAGALVQSFLERFIITHMKDKQPNLIGMIFNNRGPLSDFHSKILVAQAFGLISCNSAAELHRIKSIRNVFAHATSLVNFETEEISKEIMSFIMMNAMKNVPRPDGQ
jgi:hypothetical protein